MSVNTDQGLIVVTTAPGHGVDIHWIVILTPPVSGSLWQPRQIVLLLLLPTACDVSGGTHLVQQGTGKHKNVIN